MEQLSAIGKVGYYARDIPNGSLPKLKKMDWAGIGIDSTQDLPKDSIPKQERKYAPTTPNRFSNGSPQITKTRTFSSFSPFPSHRIPHPLISFLSYTRRAISVFFLVIKSSGPIPLTHSKNSRGRY